MITTLNTSEEHREEVVVVCTDLSEHSGALLQHAKEMCLRNGSTLQVVHVFEVEDVSEMTTSAMAECLDEVEILTQRLHSVVERLHVPGLKIKSLLLVGNVVQQIREFVGDLSPSLLIMGTAGKRGLERVFLGSTAEAILRSVSCPVLTIGPNATGYAHGPVVLPTDFNRCAMEDVRFALTLAVSLGVRLRCVHFLPPKVSNAKNSIVRSVLTDALRKLTQDAGAEPDAVEIFVESGSYLSRDIVEFARNASASAIVLGVLRRTAWQSHLPAHETFKVLATATCPVYTISHSKEEPVLPQVA